MRPCNDRDLRCQPRCAAPHSTKRQSPPLQWPSKRCSGCRRRLSLFGPLRSPSSELRRRLKRGIDYAAAARPCKHRVDTFGCAENSGLIHGDTDSGPGLTIVSASEDAGAEVRMEPRHKDAATVARLIDLHLPVWVLVALDPCPRAPPVARSPCSNLSSGSLGNPHPCVARCIGATGIDEKDDARAASLFHAVSDRRFGPVQPSVQALNNQARPVPAHEQVIRIIGIDGADRNPVDLRRAPRDS